MGGVAIANYEFETSHVHVLKTSWVVGIDLGQASDPTALCAVERLEHHCTNQWTPGGKPLPGFTLIPCEKADGNKPSPALHIRALQRLPLGLSYVEIAERLASMLSAPQLRDAQVFMDATGVGRPVCDLMKHAGIKHTAVTITGGRDEVQHSSSVLSVSKLLLISRLQASLHSGELKIARSLPEAQAFTRELQEFRVSWTESGNLRFSARQGAHDDLVLSAALAVYGATRPRPPKPCNWRFET